MKQLDWNLWPPSSAPLGDHDVAPRSTHLAGHRIALLVCGGIAAMKTPMVARLLRARGAEVVAFVSSDALAFVGPQALEWATCNPIVTQLTWRSEHLSDSAPFSAYLVAPATYNTIGKFAAGIADTVITATLASALGRMEQRQTEILIAPTMHGSMHTSILVETCRTLEELGVKFITPRDDYGKHNLPCEETLAAAVIRCLSTSPLRNARLTVRPSDKLSPQAAAAITEELLLRGARVHLELPAEGWQAPLWLARLTDAPHDNTRVVKAPAPQADEPLQQWALRAADLLEQGCK